MKYLVVLLMVCCSVVNALQVTDDRGVTVTFAQTPQRIVSMLPSLTEGVCAMDQCQRLVGVDRYSNFPDSLKTLPKLGGGMDPNIEGIVALKPDVVLVSGKSRSTERLEALGIKVVALEPKSHADVKRVLEKIGQVLDVPDAQRVWRAIDAASTKPFGYMRFTPGPGVGGHCLPIDPSYLAWRVKQHLGRTFRFVELANDVNEHMPDYVHDRVTAMLNRERKAVNGSRVLLLGLAYKKATSDWRESPSVHVADRLRASGADVRFCDPYIPEVNALHLADSLVPFSRDERVLQHLPGNAPALQVVQYLGPALIAAHSALVFDTKNLLQGHEFRGELL